jgi:hypothetical protein
MEKLSNIHPGEVLLFEFLNPLGISAYRLSKDLNIPQTRISQIIKGKAQGYSRYGVEAECVFWKFARVLAWLAERLRH